MWVLHFPHVTIKRATEAAQPSKGICVQIKALHILVESMKIQTRFVQHSYVISS